MKEFDQIFKQLDQAIQEVDKSFKQIDSEVDRVFKKVEKMLSDAEFIARKQEVGPWKEWFAWRPVKVKGKRVWLKKVVRRCINTYVDHDNWKRYEYGTIFDAIKDAE